MYKNKLNQTLPTKQSNNDPGILSSKSTNSRILKTNLVYIIGLTKEIANVKTLSKPEFFGQYGRILSLVVNYKPLKPKDCEEYYAAYITFSTAEEASLAILAVDNTNINKTHCIRATFGNTKYCENFLKKKKCTIKDCLFVHSNNSQEVIVERDDLSKVSYRDLRQKAARLANIFDNEVRARLMKAEKIKDSLLPHVSSIYTKPPIYSNDPLYLEIQESNNNYKNQINGEIQTQDKAESSVKIAPPVNKKGISGLKELLSSSVKDYKEKETVNDLQELIVENQEIDVLANADTEQTETGGPKSKTCSEDYGSAGSADELSKDISAEMNELLEEKSAEFTTQELRKSIKKNESLLSLTKEGSQNLQLEGSELSCQSLFDDNGKEVQEIPEIILRITKNRSKNNKIDNQNKYSKICGFLRTQILTFAANGLGSSDSESKWAQHMLENESTIERE